MNPNVAVSRPVDRVGHLSLVSVSLTGEHRCGGVWLRLRSREVQPAWCPAPGLILRVPAG